MWLHLDGFPHAPCDAKVPPTSAPGPVQVVSCTLRARHSLTPASRTTSLRACHGCRLNAAQATVISVAGKNAPADPIANLDAAGADINFQDNQLVDIVIETKNLDINSGIVTARIAPKERPSSNHLRAVRFRNASESHVGRHH